MPYGGRKNSSEWCRLIIFGDFDNAIQLKSVLGGEQGGGRGRGQ